MADTRKIIIEDAEGNTYLPQTTADIVQTSDGQTVEKVTADLTSFRLIADVPATTLKKDQAIDYGYIRTLQETLLGEFFQKLAAGTAIIDCNGDSMTNGHDTTSSDKRPVTADPTRQSGDPASTQTIASTTYPEALQGYLRSILGNGIRVINRGYSGDHLKAGYDRYRTNTQADLSLMMYGTNDSRATWVPEEIRGNISQYIKWYEQYIIRQIYWGKAVIIMAPPKLMAAADQDVRTFTRSLKLLGEKYGIPVIYSAEFTANYPYSIYSDATHYNSRGYKLFASKVAAFLLGGIHPAKTVKGGDTLLTRPDLDSVTYFGGSSFDVTYGGAESPEETIAGTGITANWTGANRGIIYSFYAEENDLMLIPIFYAPNTGVRVTLDFDAIAPQNSLDTVVNMNAGQSEQLPTQAVYSTITSAKVHHFIQGVGGTEVPVIRVAEKGWHTVRIDSANGEEIRFNGLHFMSSRDFLQQKEMVSQSSRITASGTEYRLLTHSFYDPNTSVAKTKIAMSQLNAALGNPLNGVTYFRNPALKMTVMNHDRSVIEYGLAIPTFNGTGGGTFKYWQINKYDIVDRWNGDSERYVENMTYDTTTGDIEIEWKGSLTKHSSIVIKTL